MAMSRQKFLTILLPSLIFLTAFIQYANTLGHDYAWDDKLVITGNEYTRRGVEGLRDIFTHRVSVPNKNVYRPLPQALFAVEYQAFHGNPHAGHFFSVLWFAALCVIIYFFLKSVFPDAHPLFPLLCTLLYAVHPLHVEVVANIKSRDEILALLFALGAIMLLVRTVERGKWRFLIPGLLCLGLAALSKENALTVLPVSALILWYHRDRIRARRRVVVPLFLSGLALIVILWLRYTLASTKESDSMRLESTVLNNIFLWTSEPRMVIPTALVCIGRYLLLFLYPRTLVHLYGYNQIPLSGWTDPETIAVLALAGATAYYVVKHRTDGDPAVFGILFFACTYAVYSNLFVLAPDTMADRYMFIPSLGLSVIAAAGIFRFAGSDVRGPLIRGTRSYAALAVVVLALSGFAVRTYTANLDWKNDSTLIHNRIASMENNAAAQATLGYMLFKESESAPPGGRPALLNASMKAFTRSVEIYPDFPLAWISMGKLFTELGFYDKAELAFLRAQRIEPSSPESYFCLGSLYYTLGDGDLAAPYLETSLSLGPRSEQTFVMLGKAYIKTGNTAGLGALAGTGMKWFPGNAEFDAFMATYMYRTRRYKDAMGFLRQSLEKDPGNLTARALSSSPAFQTPETLR